MSHLNEDLILEYLIENIDTDLSKKHSLKETLILDYCYKKNETVPKDIINGFLSKILNKQINNSSKSIKLDKSNLDNCLFLEYFKSLLSNQTKSLVKNAKTAQDFKAIIIINELSRGFDNPSAFLNSSNSLNSKVFHMVKRYKDSRFENELNKEYTKMEEYSLRVSAELQKPISRNLVEKLGHIKQELDEKKRIYLRYNNKGSAPELQNLVWETIKSIDNKLSDFISNVDQRYNKVKRDFDNGVWDSRRKINRLINSRSELKAIEERYRLVSDKEGVKRCNSLDKKIKDTIFNYDYVKDKKEEFKEVKREINNYYGKVSSIFQEGIDSSSVRKLNNIYSTLRMLSSKEFHKCVPLIWQEDYYSTIETAMDYIKQKCIKRINYLTEQSSKYRQKIDDSFFSWRTQKFAEQLKEYNDELEDWSKCRII